MQNAKNNPTMQDYDAASYTGIYSMHKYWSKKPFNIIRHFIEEYSKEGEMVLDPFCGSGVSIAESVFCNRQAIGIDINPAAILITTQLLTVPAIDQVYDIFQRLKTACADQIHSLYAFQMEKEHLIGTHFIWKGAELVEIWTKQGKTKRIISLSEIQQVKSSNYTYKDIKEFYPQIPLFENSRVKVRAGMMYRDLFTPRNLLALSLLWKEILLIEDSTLREFFQFCFTACLGQTSKMVFVIQRRGKFKVDNKRKTPHSTKEVGSWVIGFWIPHEHFEIDVWNCFENRYRKIVKAKANQQNSACKVLVRPIMGEEFVAFQQQQIPVILYNASAREILPKIPANSIDYIITDPPHGSRVPYLELSLLWNAWFPCPPNYQDEIVVSDSKPRSKDYPSYLFQLDEVFNQIVRVLKVGAKFSLIFNSLDDEFWQQLFTSLGNKKITLFKIETMGYSANSVVQDNRKGGLKTDFIFTFEKLPENTTKVAFPHLKAVSSSEIIHCLTYCLQKTPEGLELYQILNHLMQEYLPQGKIFSIALISTILKNQFHINGSRYIL